jgi:hypothetical protein
MRGGAPERASPGSALLENISFYLMLWTTPTMPTPA